MVKCSLHRSKKARNISKITEPSAEGSFCTKYILIQTSNNWKESNWNPYFFYIIHCSATLTVIYILIICNIYILIIYMEKFRKFDWLRAVRFCVITVQLCIISANFCYHSPNYHILAGKKPSWKKQIWRLRLRKLTGASLAVRQVRHMSDQYLWSSLL